MGNVKQALELITTRLKDVNQAIEFCKEQNEPELWDDLISYSINKPCESHDLSHDLLHISYKSHECLWFLRSVEAKQSESISVYN